MFWENFLANFLSSVIAGIVLGKIGVGLYKNKIKTYINTTINQNIKELKSEINYNYCNIDKVEQGINKVETHNIKETEKNSIDGESQDLKFEIKN